MRRIRIRKGRFVAPLMFAGLLATGSYAFMASNTVPASNVGQGAQAISGYTASGVSYTLDTSSGTANVTGVSFSLSPDNGGTAPTTVKARLTSTGTYQSCTNSSGTTWTCSFTGVTALSAVSLDIAAAS
ncbi:MAG TPA: hypothetical protein VFK89_11980 [Actinomycetota bacterium]|nr:hypothetical protein [Actinomycetota bacterium]